MKTNQEMKKYRNRMRKHRTPCEQEFFGRLEKSGLDFKHQMILGFYIVDFVVPSRMAVIEIDGATHRYQQAYDAERDDLCREWGFTVFRIFNEEVSTFPLAPIQAMPWKHEVCFRRAVALANTYRSRAVKEIRWAGGTYNGK